MFSLINNSTATIGTYFATSSATTIQTTTNQPQYFVINQAAFNSEMRLTAGQELKLFLPDGSVLEVDRSGSYKIFDDDAQITYKANRVREFNRYINASDLLQEFVKFVGGIGKISKREFFDLPLELFIQWLVIRAAEVDGEDFDYDPIIKALPNAPRKRRSPQCKCCGKFIVTRELPFCSSVHMLKYSRRKMVFPAEAV